MRLKQMLRTEYLDAQRQFDKLLRIKDRQNRRERLFKLESIKTADPVTFWKEINQLGPSRANTIPMRVKAVPSPLIKIKYYINGPHILNRCIM